MLCGKLPVWDANLETSSDAYRAVLIGPRRSSLARSAWAIKSWQRRAYMDLALLRSNLLNVPIRKVRGQRLLYLHAFPRLREVLRRAYELHGL